MPTEECTPEPPAAMEDVSSGSGGPGYVETVGVPRQLMGSTSRMTMSRTVITNPGGCPIPSSTEYHREETCFPASAASDILSSETSGNGAQSQVEPECRDSQDCGDVNYQHSDP